MEQRRFGNSGLSMSVLSFGTMTIGGRERFAKMGNLGVKETARILDLCRDAGVTVSSAIPRSVRCSMTKSSSLRSAENRTWLFSTFKS